MGYFLGTIVAVSVAIIMFFSRYEADDSSFLSSLNSAEKSFLVLNENYINLYSDLSTINFAKIYSSDIFPSYISAVSGANLKFKDNSSLGTVENTIKNDINFAFENEVEADIKKYSTTKLIFPNSKIEYILVPIVTSDNPTQDSGSKIDLSKDAGNGYKLFVDFSNETALINKPAFTENRYKDLCQKELFGIFFTKASDIDGDLNLTTSGDKNDGKFACIIFK
ncbi:hypothetical protein Q6A83_07935 [Aliarcobacter skirrowii]|uniref:hypothetical protein n=1 Tax=Aliarcobacter skirrowii TaxID=28200 RepID=UPI0029BBECA7|nr:hypothetical protein [Aliarcobacter skirrowii]MDX4050698.1 hypothetical protein [Aliarcobacter skirrowii]